MSKVIVIGESCLDEFVYCKAERLAPDLPIPILRRCETKNNPGMAMNVFRNINSYIDDCDIETNQNWKEIKKTRYVEINSNHTFIRIDSEENVGEFHSSKNLRNYDLVVLSDYNKGFLSEKEIQKITKIHSNVFLDTKKTLGEWANNAAYIKINDYEYNRSLPFIDEKLRSKIIHTMGGQGCEYQDKSYSVPRVEVKDSSGAGDSFLAALIVKFVETNDIIESIKFANLSASKVVSQRGVTLI